MSITRVSRAERFLENAVSFGKLTSSGKDFLIAALDPFHDQQLKDLQGWPDLETSSSVVRLIKQTISVKAPVGTVNPWDMYVDLWPWLNSLLFISTSHGGGSRRNDNLVIDTNGSGTYMGGLTVWATNAGTAVDFGNSANRIGMINLPEDYSKGSQRVVGIGFEVVNTTAEIYRQGQAVVYRQSNPVNKTTTMFMKEGPGGAGTFESMSFCPIPSPPTTIASTLLIPGSRQWAAEEGCYCVGCFCGQDNPPHIVGYTGPLVYTTEGGADTAYNVLGAMTTGPNMDPVYVPARILYPGSATSLTQPVVVHPIHMSGARFTGLSTQSTFSITLNIYLETFPTVAEAGILVLATPSAQYDPVALEIFSNALTQLPVGVMVRENGLGDWFSDAVMTTSKYLSPVLEAAGFTGLAKGAKVAGQLAKKWREDNGYMTAPNTRSDTQPIPKALPAPRGRSRQPSAAPRRPRRKRKAPPAAK